MKYQVATTYSHLPLQVSVLTIKTARQYANEKPIFKRAVANRRNKNASYG
ncbi:hypothetical protein V8043_002825 [Vibrio vulnificus]